MPYNLLNKMYMYQSKNVQKRENKGILLEHFLDTEI